MSSFNKLANLHNVFFKRAEGERLKVNPNDSGRIELPDPVHRYPPGLYDKLFPSKVPSKVPPKVPPKGPVGKATVTPPQQRVPAFPTKGGFNEPNKVIDPNRPVSPMPVPY